MQFLHARNAGKAMELPPERMVLFGVNYADMKDHPGGGGNNYANRNSCDLPGNGKKVS